MDDAFGVGGVEGVGNFDGERQENIHRHGTAVDAVLKSDTV